MFTINLVSYKSDGEEVETFYSTRSFQLEHKSSNKAILRCFGLGNGADDAYIPIGFPEDATSDSQEYKKVFVMNESGKTVCKFVAD